MNQRNFERSELREAIARVLAIELKASEERVRRAQSLRSELGLDSIAAANATFALEDEFSVEIEVEEGDTFDTLDGLVALLERALSVRPLS